MIKMNNDEEYSCIISARERTTVPSLRAKRPLVSTTSQRCAGNLTWIKQQIVDDSKCRFQMVWTGWRIAWQSSGRGASTLEWWRQVRWRSGKKILKKTRPRKHMIALFQRGLCRSPRARLQGSSTSGRRYLEERSKLLMSSVSEVSTFQKGLIAPGSDADIVVWNPNKTRSSVLRYFSSCFLF